MKNFALTIVVSLLVYSNGTAQQEKGIIGFNSWLNNWTEFKPNKSEYNEPNQIITGTIAVDSKLYKKKCVFVNG